MRRFLVGTLALLAATVLVYLGFALIFAGLASAHPPDDLPGLGALDGDPRLVLAQVADPAPPAVQPPDPGVDPVGFAKQLLEAAKTKAWRPFVALVLVGLVWLGRKFAGKWVPWFRTDRGGAALALLVGVFGSIATVLFAGAALSVAAFVDGVVMGVTAAGGYVVLRRLLWPKDAPPPKDGSAYASIPETLKK